MDCPVMEARTDNGGFSLEASILSDNSSLYVGLVQFQYIEVVFYLVKYYIQ